MMLRLICLTWCLVLTSGKPATKYHQEDLLDMVKRALEGGLHQSLDVAKQLVSSDLDALEGDIKKNGFKSGNVMKAPNAAQIKKNLHSDIKVGKYEQKIFKSVKAAVCSKGEGHLEEAVDSFMDFLATIRNNILTKAAGKYLDSVEDFVGTTSIDFDDEERKIVKEMDLDGDVTIENFHDEIKNAVAICKKDYVGCKDDDSDVGEYVDVKDQVDDIIDTLQKKLENVRKAAS